MITDSSAKTVIVDERVEIGKTHNHFSLAANPLGLTLSPTSVHPHFNSGFAALLLQAHEDFLLIDFEEAIKLLKVCCSLDDGLARAGTTKGRRIDC